MVAPAAVLPFVDSSPSLDDEETLRARLDHDGYLFFRGLLPADEVQQVRADVLAAVAHHGWLDDRATGRLDHDAVATISADDLREDIGVSADGYASIQRVESMHRLPHHPVLLDLFARLLGDVFVHPRHIVRAMTAHPELAPTPPHQDYPLVQGSSATYTCWIPLGDCPRSMGGLSVLEASHQAGYIPIADAKGAGGLQVQRCDADPDVWRSTDYQTGDALIFPAFTVHRSLPPADRDHIRLSMDVRYQSAGDVIEERSLTNHAEINWDDTYSDWVDTELQYYWRAQQPRIEPWDDTLIQPSRRIC